MTRNLFKHYEVTEEWKTPCLYYILLKANTNGSVQHWRHSVTDTFNHKPHSHRNISSQSQSMLWGFCKKPGSIEYYRKLSNFFCETWTSISNIIKILSRKKPKPVWTIHFSLLKYNEFGWSYGQYLFSENTNLK